jgi:hypothetical protein
MQITNVLSSSYAAAQKSATSTRAASPSPLASSDNTTNSGTGVSSYDFSNMTPSQLQSTVNDLVKSGKLSLKDSSPLLTIAGFSNRGNVDGASSAGADKPIDVLSALQAGISYKQQNQVGTGNSGIENWTNALATLQSLQGTTSGVDTYA